MDLAFLKKLSEASGVSGREEEVRELLRPEVEKRFPEVHVDAMGSLIATKKAVDADAKKVIFACHIDEIGFYVRHVDDKGFCRIQNAGGFDTRNLFARRVKVRTATGDMVGLLNPAGRPIHIAKEEEKKKVPEMSEFTIDFGLPGEVVKEKVRIGDPVTLVQTFDEIGEVVSGKCLDNRVAAFVVLEAMKKCKPKYHVTLACTVQEEVGLRGAGPAAWAVEPDIAVAVDTTLCVDTPDVPEHERVNVQGAGVSIKIMDGSTIGHRGLIDTFIDVAKAKGIPHQLSILPRGGTDAGAMQRLRAGVPTAILAVPTRYIHTVTESIHKRDLQATIDLIAAWLEA